MKTLKIEVVTPVTAYFFEALFHQSDSPESQVIEPEFYLKENDKLHEGTHYEIQLVDSPVWGRVNEEVPIHIHQNPNTGLYFVCFTGQLPSLNAAEMLFKTWCVGTAYTLEHEKDFAPIAGAHPGDYFQFMSLQHNITPRYV